MSNIITSGWTNCFDFKHDMSGNPTSHFEVWIDGKQIKRTKRRRQIGYNGYTSTAADMELGAHVRGLFGEDVVIVLDPSQHPFPFGDKKPQVDRIDRSGSNIRHYLVVNGTAEEFYASEQAIRMRLMGLVPEFLRAHRHTIKNVAELTVAQADVTVLLGVTARDGSASATGSYMADDILKTALLAAIESL